MKRSTTLTRILRWNLALILFYILLTPSVEASSQWLSQGAVGPGPEASNPISPQLIDPTLQWHTFIDGSNNQWGNSIASDGSGNTYVVGYSYATRGNPVRARAGGKDAFTVGSTTEDSYTDNNTSSVWVLIPSDRVFLPLVTRDL
jgi:hypothetical protein